MRRLVTSEFLREPVEFVWELLASQIKPQLALLLDNEKQDDNTRMKVTIIIGVILYAAVAVLSRQQPSLQPYPTVFSALYNESSK